MLTENGTQTGPAAITDQSPATLKRHFPQIPATVVQNQISDISVYLDCKCSSLLTNEHLSFLMFLMTRRHLQAHPSFGIQQLPLLAFS